MPGTPRLPMLSTLPAPVAQTIADMGDNPDVGNRSSGSPAEKQAAGFIEQTMKDIGLQNVTVDPITLDNWTFNRGRVYYTDARGEQQFFPLGGFATNLTCDMQEVSVVYVGRGTAEDYEGLDVEGKVVLFDIDQSEDVQQGRRHLGRGYDPL